MDSTDIIAAARREHRAVLSEPEAKRILRDFGIAVPQGVVTRCEGDIAAALAKLHPPLAVKLLSAGVTHKTDVGGVRLGLRDAAEARAAFDGIAAEAARHGHNADVFLVEEMAPAGQEVVIGGMQDPRFGPVVMLGLGGIFVEIFADAAFRVCPIDHRDARSMIEELRSRPLLRGARGRPPVAEHAICDALVAIGGPSGLMLRLEGEIAELDVNPLIVSPAGAIACDCRIVLTETAHG